MKEVSQNSSVTLFGIPDNRDGVSDNVGHTLLQCDYNSVHANYYKPYNFIKSGMKKLKVVEVIQYNDVNNKVTSTNRTTVNIGLLH